MATKLSRAQREALEKLVQCGGEAIRHKPWFENAAGRVICDVDVMERLRKKKAVTIESVGQSVFAIATDAGRAALSEGEGQ